MKFCLKNISFSLNSFPLLRYLIIQWFYLKTSVIPWKHEKHYNNFGNFTMPKSNPQLLTDWNLCGSITTKKFIYRIDIRNIAWPCQRFWRYPFHWIVLYLIRLIYVTWFTWLQYACEWLKKAGNSFLALVVSKIAI